MVISSTSRHRRCLDKENKPFAGSNTDAADIFRGSFSALPVKKTSSWTTKRPASHHVTGFQHSVHHKWLLLLLVLMVVIAPSVIAWHGCSSASDEASGICPDGNTCCLDTASTTATCISGKSAWNGNCCSDTIQSTGCGGDFHCAWNSTANYAYCSRFDPNDVSLPDAVPRYRLCSVHPERILKEVYGLPVPSSEKEETTSTGAVAYFSTKGPIDSSEPETLKD
jgi:hypothetical protein